MTTWRNPLSSIALITYLSIILFVSDSLFIKFISVETDPFDRALAACFATVL